MLISTKLEEKGIQALKNISFIKSCKEEIQTELESDSEIDIIQHGMKSGNGFSYKPYPMHILKFKIKDNIRYAIYEEPNSFKYGEYIRYIADKITDDDIKTLQNKLISKDTKFTIMMNKNNEGYVIMKDGSKLKLMPSIDNVTKENSGCVIITKNDIQIKKP